MRWLVEYDNDTTTLSFRRVPHKTILRVPWSARWQGITPDSWLLAMTKAPQTTRTKEPPEDRTPQDMWDQAVREMELTQALQTRCGPWRSAMQRLRKLPEGGLASVLRVLLTTDRCDERVFELAWWCMVDHTDAALPANVSTLLKRLVSFEESFSAHPAVCAVDMFRAEVVRSPLLACYPESEHSLHKLAQAYKRPTYARDGLTLACCFAIEQSLAQLAHYLSMSRGEEQCLPYWCYMVTQIRHLCGRLKTYAPDRSQDEFHIVLGTKRARDESYIPARSRKRLRQACLTEHYPLIV